MVPWSWWCYNGWSCSWYWQLEISEYQSEADVDDGNAANLGDGDDQQILAHVTQYKAIPPSDIQQVLAA